jgi:hypothetical protein
MRDSYDILSGPVFWSFNGKKEGFASGTAPFCNFCCLLKGILLFFLLFFYRRGNERALEVSLFHQSLFRRYPLCNAFIRNHAYVLYEKWKGLLIHHLKASGAWPQNSRSHAVKS